MTETMTVWKHKENMLVKRREPSLWFATITNLKRISVFLVSYYIMLMYFTFYIIPFNSIFFLIFLILIIFAFSATKVINSKSTFPVNF